MIDQNKQKEINLQNIIMIFFTNNHICNSIASLFITTQNQTQQHNYNQQAPKISTTQSINFLIRENPRQIALGTTHFFNKTIDSKSRQLSRNNHILQTMKRTYIKINSSAILITEKTNETT